MLPPLLRDLTSSIAEAHRVPAALPGGCILAALAGAVGKGIRLESGPDHMETPANLYVVLSADSGTGKSRVFGVILDPIFEYEAELLESWKMKEGPQKEAEEILLAKQIEEIKKGIKKDISNAERYRIIATLAHPKARLEELKAMGAPRLICQDATIEALGIRLSQSNEAILSACADARKLGDNLLGRNNPGKMVDDSIYLQAFSGDSIVVDRQSRESLILRQPCLTLLWLLQPDILEKLLSESALQMGGFLARLLLCHTDAKAQEWDWQASEVPPELLKHWRMVIRDLLKLYRDSDSPLLIKAPREVWEIFRDYHNPIVNRLHGDLADVKPYAMRWTEQAMRLSLIHHVGLHVTNAHEHDLSPESASAGIALATWFAEGQLQILARGRQESRKKLEDRVLALLDENWQRRRQDYITARQLQNRHITRAAAEAQSLLGAMVHAGILECEEIRRPQGGHVERRYRRKDGPNPVSC